MHLVKYRKMLQELFRVWETAKGYCSCIQEGYKCYCEGERGPRPWQRAAIAIEHIPWRRRSQERCQCRSGYSVLHFKPKLGDIGKFQFKVFLGLRSECSNGIFFG